MCQQAVAVGEITLANRPCDMPTIATTGSLRWAESMDINLPAAIVTEAISVGYLRSQVMTALPQKRWRVVKHGVGNRYVMSGLKVG